MNSGKLKAIPIIVGMRNFFHHAAHMKLAFTHNYLKIALLTLMLTVFAGIVSAEKITIQSELPPEKQLQKNVTINVPKEHRLSAKKIKNKTDSGNMEIKSAASNQIKRYKQFPDGEGEAKTRK